MDLTVSGLRRVVGKQAKAAILQAIVDRSPVVLPRYGIESPLRLRHFFAQLAHESDRFKTTEEYASGAAYEGRADLGNTKKGDGKRYKGRGLIQLTGRANYRTFGEKLGVDLENNPAMAAQPGLSLEIACEYWKAKKLNTCADRDDILTITKRINGGTNGLSDRKEWLQKFKALFPDQRVAALVSFDDDGGADTQPTVLNVQPDAKAFSAAVLTVQRELVAIGYQEIGAVDGKWGGRTRGGVTAFLNDRGVSSDGLMTDRGFASSGAMETVLAAVNVALAEKWTRPIAEKRATVTAKELVPEVPAVKQTWWQWIGAKWAAVTAGVGAIFSGAGDYFETARGYVEPVKDFFADVPGWLWLVGIAAAAGAMWYSSRKATEAIVEDKRTGRLN